MSEPTDVVLISTTVVPRHLLAELGDVMVSFAGLEECFRLLLARYLSETDDTMGQIVGSNLSFAALRATIISLNIHQFGDGQSLAALRAIMARAGKAEEERNRIVHSYWAYSEASGTISRMKPMAKQRRGFEVVNEEYHGARLTAFAAEIRQIADDSIDFDPWEDGLKADAQEEGLPP